MPGLRRGEEDSLSAMSIPLVDVQQPTFNSPVTECHHAAPSSDEQEPENDILGALAAPSSDDISHAAMALSRSMSANATRHRQDLEDRLHAGLFTLPPLPPPPPPPSSSWFTMLIYNITHSNFYRIITQPSTVIVDLTSRHLHSLQEYSERQRYLSDDSHSRNPLNGVLSIFSSSTASKDHESLKKRASMYHITEEEDRLARNPEWELAKAVELLPVSMDAVRPAKALPIDDDSGMDSVTSGSESSYDDDEEKDISRTAFVRARLGESGRRRRRRRRRTPMRGQGQGALAYRNPFIDQPRTTEQGDAGRHFRHSRRHPSSHDPAEVGYSSEGDEREDAFDDALEWDGDDIASGYEARTNSVRLTEKGFQKPAVSGKSMMEHDDNGHWSPSPPSLHRIATLTVAE